MRTSAAVFKIGFVKIINPMPETGLLFSPKDLRRLILPLIVEQLLSIFLGMADIVMVSTFGEEAAR